MISSRTLLVLMLCCAAPALAQAPTKTPSTAARLDALEKENASLRSDVNRLQALLVQTRREMIVAEGASLSTGTAYAAGAGSIPPTIQPMSLPAQQAQAQAAIQSQGVNQQLNNLQLNQSLMQDRARDQQLFNPQPFGGTP